MFAIQVSLIVLYSIPGNGIIRKLKRMPTNDDDDDKVKEMRSC